MIFYSLLAVIFLSPLPYGSNRPWSWSLCSLLVAVLGIIWAVQFFVAKQKSPFFQHVKSISDVVILFFIVIAWALIQASTDFAAGLNHPLWQMQSELLQSSSGSISLIPADTLTLLMRSLSYALVFWLALCYSQDIYKARRIFYGLMIAGFIYSAYGLIMHLGDFKMLLLQERPYATDVTGTFINRNHFATFAGLTLLCALALLSDSVTAASKYNIGGNLGLQRFLEKLIVRAYFPLLVFFVIGTALILSHSRGGFLSSLLGLIVLLAALNANKSSRNIYVVWIFTAFIVVGGVIFYVSSEGLLDRLNAQGLTDAAREEVYDLTWNAMLTNPWTGFGLGSFEEVFPLYKSLDVAGGIDQPSLWDYAHNTYLESIFELGFPAALALFYCFLRLAGICVKGLLVRKKDWIYPATGLAATCLIAAHANVDFSMQIPAIPYTYALLMGAACAQSFSTRNQRLSSQKGGQ
ncbi:MAG: O-antigen ligase family protein [Methylococcales bacterium]|nr:O-antigen ligase family protein [Methylococcales bacterium]